MGHAHLSDPICGYIMAHNGITSKFRRSPPCAILSLGPLFQDLPLASSLALTAMLSRITSAPRVSCAEGQGSPSRTPKAKLRTTFKKKYLGMLEVPGDRIGSEGCPPLSVSMSVSIHSGRKRSLRLNELARPVLQRAKDRKNHGTGRCSGSVWFSCSGLQKVGRGI